MSQSWIFAQVGSDSSVGATLELVNALYCNLPALFADSGDIAEGDSSTDACPLTSGCTRRLGRVHPFDA